MVNAHFMAVPLTNVELLGDLGGQLRGGARSLLWVRRDPVSGIPWFLQ